MEGAGKMLEEMMPRWVPTENVNGFVGKLQINRFRGKISLQMIVEEILH